MRAQKQKDKSGSQFCKMIFHSSWFTQQLTELSNFGFTQFLFASLFVFRANPSQPFALPGWTRFLISLKWRWHPNGYSMSVLFGDNFRSDLVPTHGYEMNIPNSISNNLEPQMNTTKNCVLQTWTKWMLNFGTQAIFRQNQNWGM